MATLVRPKFKLGRTFITPGAKQALVDSGEDVRMFLDRHVSGDWGMLDEEDRRQNELALEDGSRIFSAYTLADGQKLWVITEAEGEYGKRESTTALTPSEY